MKKILKTQADIAGFPLCWRSHGRRFVLLIPPVNECSQVTSTNPDGMVEVELGWDFYDKLPLETEGDLERAALIAAIKKLASQQSQSQVENKKLLSTANDLAGKLNKLARCVRELENQVEDFKTEREVRKRLGAGWQFEDRLTNPPTHSYVYYTYKYRRYWVKAGKKPVLIEEWCSGGPNYRDGEETHFLKTYRRVRREMEVKNEKK